MHRRVVRRLRRRPEDLRHHHRQKYRSLSRHPKDTPLVLDRANPFGGLDIRATVELEADPDKALLAKSAARYSIFVEVLDQAGGDRVIATFDPTGLALDG